MDVSLANIRHATRSVALKGWYEWGEVLGDDVFILGDEGFLRVVESICRRYIICNQWKTASMDAPAFYYYAVDVSEGSQYTIEGDTLIRRG